MFLATASSHLPLFAFLLLFHMLNGVAAPGSACSECFEETGDLDGQFPRPPQRIDELVDQLTDYCDWCARNLCRTWNFCRVIRNKELEFAQAYISIREQGMPGNRACYADHICA